MIHLMRHAHAGTRLDWSGADEDRPLSDLGRDEAESVAEHLAQLGITRILTSPYARCIQSVEPLSRLTGVTLEIETALSEGADPAQTEGLLMGSGPGTIACSHGDVISAFLGRAAAEGATLEGGLRFRKASVWHLETGPTGRIRSGRYDPPPLTGS